MKIKMNDGSIQEAGFEEELGKNAFRHTTAHILAQAVKRLYPTTKCAIGPSIAEGFYYDFDFDFRFSEENFAEIEAEMKKIVKENLQLRHFTADRRKAEQLMEERDETYKLEILKDLPEDETISFYQQGEYLEMCAGPHAAYTSAIRAFKLLSVAGAYWRGDEKNKMLTRIYGTSFPDEGMLAEYLNRLEEAKKRDHRKLGKELGLFALFEEGPGFPFFLKKSADRLLEKAAHKRRVCGDLHAGHAEPAALGDIRALGALQGQDVYDFDRRGRFCDKTHELSGRNARIQNGTPFLP